MCLPQLKAYHDAAAERYKADLKAQIIAAERTYRTLLLAAFHQEADAEMEAMATSDPVFRAIRDKPATDWFESQESNWLSRRGDARVSRIEPVCVRITHYKRVGPKARYAFKTFLRSHKGRRSPATCFWITYLDLLNLPSAKELLNKTGWHMGAYFDEHNDGETPWGSDYPSFEEGPPERRVRARRARSGSEHPLVMKRGPKRG